MTDAEMREIEERAKAAEEGESMEKVCSNCYPVAYDIPKLLSYIRELREENEQLAEEANDEASLRYKTDKEVEALTETLKKAVAILEWYSDPGNYLSDESGSIVADAWRNDRISLKASRFLVEEIDKNLSI